MSTPGELDSTFSRVFSITVDKYGVDPLLDQMIPYVMSITTYSNHEVVQDERGAPDLICLREYGTDELWWMMMAYNKIGRTSLIVEGTTVKIPAYSELVRITGEQTIRSSYTQRVITI